MLQGPILNNNYWQWGSKWVDGILNPDSISIEMYETMLDTDETLASGVEFVVMAALARLGEYSHPKPSIQKFVRKALEAMDGSWTEAVAEILTAIPFGFSVTEQIWRFDGSAVTLDHLQTLHPGSITFDLATDGPRKNRLSRVWQWWRAHNEVELPIPKCIIYSHRKRFGNPYGKSRFRSCYKDWFLKDVMLKCWGITMERYGSPHAVAKTTNSGTIEFNGKTYQPLEYAMQALKALAANGSIAVDENTEVELFQAARSVGNDFEGIVAYCNKMMYRALLLPSLIADHGGGTGSYSLGQKHFDLFVLMLEKLLDDLIEQLIEQLVRRLIEFNFGPQDDYGTFLVEEFQTDDLKLVSECFTNLVNAGIIRPELAADLNEMRERVGFPALEESDIEALTPPADPAPAEGQPADPAEDPTGSAPADDQAQAPEQMASSLGARKRLRQKRKASLWYRKRKPMMVPAKENAAT